MISRKVVYIHKLKEDAEVSGKHFKSGKILYIGSGHKRRVVAKVNRTEVHLLLWDKLDKEIIADDLSLEQAYELEQKLVLEHWDSFLLNKKKIIDKVKTYKFEELDKVFYIDENSVLRWKLDRRSGRCDGIRVKAGVAAGYSSRDGYMIVSINRVNYVVHRIIWCLHNKQDVPAGMVVDHIDRNPANNHHRNLRLVSQSVNQRNKEVKLSSTGHRNIYYDPVKKTINVRYRLESVAHCKFFSIKKHIKSGNSEEDSYKIALNLAIQYLASTGSNK